MLRTIVLESFSVRVSTSPSRMKIKIKINNSVMFLEMIEMYLFLKPPLELKVFI